MSSTEYPRPRDRAVRHEPPPRPGSDATLGFSRKPPVRWFSPGVLADAGLRVVLSSVFGAFLDKRELQSGVDSPVVDHLAERDELWLDYLSDTGDGFDPTYTMAWLASQPALELPGVGQPLPRGDVLVLGGDEVYPTASPQEYEDRFVGPFRAARPWAPPPQAADMFALPGNHDWYDGLTSFIRIFCQRKWVGAWRTWQGRSYFAVPLPHRWWLWGIDIQLDTYIDEPQLAYFERVVEQHMRPGDRIVLCTAKPSWVDTSEEPAAYRNLAYLERSLIRPAEARLMLTLTGDSHHYSRFSGTDGTHKLTAGGGGAFLHPTHGLPDTVSLQVDDRDPSPQVYARQACYPEAATSRRLALGALTLPLRNRTFMVIPAVAHVLLLLASQFSLRTLGEHGDRSLSEAVPRFGLWDLVLGLVRSPLAVALIVTLAAGLVGFAKAPSRWAHGRPRRAAKAVMGLTHGLFQLLALLAVAWVSIRFASVAEGAVRTGLLIFLVAALGGIAGGLVMGAYLALCNAVPGLDAHGNEAFSAQGLTGYKNLVRLHIDRQGVLRVYPLGVERVGSGWRLNPDPDPSAPWLVPEGARPEVHLIEGPLVIDPGPG
ncbi:MAG: metallophosphoesterase [Actinomycetota bacterium]|nr:metallophosphoesterase [Actinomycetota bacterium]